MVQILACAKPLPRPVFLYWQVRWHSEALVWHMMFGSMLKRYHSYMIRSINEQFCIQYLPLNVIRVDCGSTSRLEAGY